MAKYQVFIHGYFYKTCIVEANCEEAAEEKVRESIHDEIFPSVDDMGINYSETCPVTEEEV